MSTDILNRIKTIFAKAPFTFLVLGLFAFVGCEPNLKEVDRLANMKKEEAVDISRQVNIMYSDSSIVKADLTAPEMRIKHAESQSYEFPKGVKIIFYDNKMKETQNIVSDYAIQDEKNKTTTFKKNVVVTMADGSVIKTEEIVYNEEKQTFYNNVPITAFFKDNRGNLQGTSFESDKDFKQINITNATGYSYMSNSSIFPTFGR